MKFLLILILIGMINSTKIWWQGNNDTYWQNRYNWLPIQIPDINSEVYIIRNQSNIPPYSQLPIECGYLYNDYQLNIYSAELTVNRLDNHGSINLYLSRLNVNQEIIKVNRLDIVESEVYMKSNPIIVLRQKDDYIKGSGKINGTVYNLGGYLYIMPNRNLIINQYTQGDRGTLIVPLQLNQLIIQNHLDLSGFIIVYTDYGINHNLTVTIIRCLDCHYFRVDPDLKLIDHDSGTTGIWTSQNHTVQVKLKIDN
jgi:hypothetical protein